MSFPRTVFWIIWLLTKREFSALILLLAFISSLGWKHFPIFLHFVQFYIVYKYLAKWKSKIRHNNNLSKFEFPWTVFWILWLLLQKGNLVWNESKYSMLRSFVPLFFKHLDKSRIPRLGTAMTHLTMNVHELFSELFEYLQKENLVRWFFYWLYIFSKDGNIFPYFSTLYSFISSKYLAKWNSKIRHSNNPFEFVDMCVMHHLQYYLSCMEYICTL